jgi:hypothetical protein
MQSQSVTVALSHKISTKVTIRQFRDTAPDTNFARDSLLKNTPKARLPFIRLGGTPARIDSGLLGGFLRVPDGALFRGLLSGTSSQLSAALYSSQLNTP